MTTLNVYADPNPSLVLAACVAYDRLYGYDTDGPEYARLKATLFELIGKRPHDGDLERVLKGVSDYQCTERDRPAICHEGIEAHPGDTDYGPTLTAYLAKIDEDVQAAIGGLL
jgi:hypothetical protein